MAFYSGQTSVGTAATLIDGVLINAAGGNPYRLICTMLTTRMLCVLEVLR